MLGLVGHLGSVPGPSCCLPPSPSGLLRPGVHAAPAPSAMELATFQSLSAGIQNLVFPSLFPLLPPQEEKLMSFKKMYRSTGVQEGGETWLMV